jgi:hypothetical protein
MTTSRSRALLVVALIAGFVSALVLARVGVGSEVVISIAGVVLAICGVGGVVSAVLLASGHIRPSRRWGASPLGVVLKAIAPLSLAWLTFRSADTQHLPWFVGFVPAIALVVGVLIDQRAWKRHHAT